LEVAVILDRISGPRDLASLDENELVQLAAEIRSFLVDAVSKTGGHLGPNLGVVELTIALHRVFESPKDAIIWDTGHQSYVHKILTGRRHLFGTLRQAGGISGYPSRSESAHDFVENSHASVALGYAAGLAESRRRHGLDGRVIAVVGDGALTGGVALEALNNIGAMQLDVLVVLNDNGRSYQPTVGSLASYLSRLRLDPRYRKAKKGIERMLESVPAVGASLAEEAKRLKQGLKQLVSPQVIFEDLGFYYAGPIDGHDLHELERAMVLAKDIEGPVLLHVLTEKGHGYSPAIEDEIEKAHALGAFDPLTGKPTKPKPRSWTSAFAEVLCQIAEERPDVVGITAAMASPTGLSKLAERFPDRVFDVGIAEQFATVFAAGLAMGGCRPIVAIYSTFLQRAFDQLMMDVCLHRLPVLFVIDRAGITGDDGPSHHGVFDLSYLRAMPNMVIAAPRDEFELRDLLYTALEHDGPFAIRFPKGSVPEAEARPRAILPIGSWEILREGEDVCVLAVGKTVSHALEAAEKLEGEGVSARVVNARFVKPLPDDLMSYVGGFDLVVTVEDNVLAGGFGSAVLEALSGVGPSSGNRPAVERVGVPDRFLEHASQDIWYERLGLDASGLKKRILDAVESIDRARLG
jgi:1-deoxy-D-xylulose-5-phosphate synthase